MILLAIASWPDAYALAGGDSNTARIGLSSHAEVHSTGATVGSSLSCMRMLQRVSDESLQGPWRPPAIGRSPGP